MDLITQGILGAAIAEAGWRKNLGRGAIFAGILFGLMPDFDVISSLWGPWTGIVHHRGFTHSIFFAPLVAPLAGYAAWRLSKRRGKVTQWMHCIFWALLTHPLLDVFTTYGTQLLTPVSNERFALDGISIIDPVYTLPLLGALILAYIWRKKPARGQRLAAAALAFSTAYLGVGYMMGQSARDAVETQLSEEEVEIGRVKAAPTFANLVLWRVMAEDSEGTTHIGLYSVRKQNTIAFDTVPKLESPLIDRALEDERAQLFKWFANDWIGYEVEESPEQTILYMNDLRYGGMRKLSAPMWGAKVTFAPDQERITNVERVNYQRARAGQMGEEFDALVTGVIEGPQAIKK